MTVKDNFNNKFDKSELEIIYKEKIILSSATGIDHLTHKKIYPDLDENLSIVSRKSIDGTYQFSKYKLKLISKGRGKPPREISISTIRDRIALKALCNFLNEHYTGTVSFELPQTVAQQVKVTIDSGKYDNFIKLDVTNFYPSIKHNELLGRLRRKIRSPEIIDIIMSAISSPTVVKSHVTDKPNSKGVPQGLAISNILAAIYLLNIDKKYSAVANAKYFRYVDDILILCKAADTESLTKAIIKDFKKLGLEVYDPVERPDKSYIGALSSTFGYLGYQYETRKLKGIDTPIVTVRSGSIEKLRDSLVSLFTAYKHAKAASKSQKYLLWRLNLRITGFVFQKKSRGWLLFFSEINDESLLHSLDTYIESLVSRFGVSITPKKFVKTYYEIKHNKHETNYIPDFDSYSLEQMKSVLVDYFSYTNIHLLTHEQVIQAFKKRISRQAQDLLADVIDAGIS